MFAAFKSFLWFAAWNPLRKRVSLIQLDAAELFAGEKLYAYLAPVLTIFFLQFWARMLRGVWQDSVSGCEIMILSNSRSLQL